MIKYLGSVISDDARCEKEIKKRIALGKSAFTKLEKILKITNISIASRIRMLNCSYVYPALTFGSEAWTLTAGYIRILENCEVCFLRKMPKISWIEKIHNEEVLRRAGEGRRLINDITVRQLRFLGHVIRKGSLENSPSLEK